VDALLNIVQTQTARIAVKKYAGVKWLVRVFGHSSMNTHVHTRASALGVLASVATEPEVRPTLSNESDLTSAVMEALVSGQSDMQRYAIALLTSLLADDEYVRVHTIH